MFGNLLNFERRKALKVLNSNGWKCSQCEQLHTGIMDVSYDRPIFLSIDQPVEPFEALRFDGDFLSQDVAVFDGQHFFVRGILYFRVQGIADLFGLGAWSSLSRKNFDIYVEHFHEDDGDTLGPWNGYFAHNVNGIPDSQNVVVSVQPREGTQRPYLVPSPDAGELFRLWDEGFTPEELVALYRTQGHVPDD